MQLCENHYYHKSNFVITAENVFKETYLNRVRTTTRQICIVTKYLLYTVHKYEKACI